MSARDRYPDLNDPVRLKELAQRIAHDPGQSGVMRQAARDIAASAQDEIDKRNDQ